jgi:hypothetical protein
MEKCASQPASGLSAMIWLFDCSKRVSLSAPNRLKVIFLTHLVPDGDVIPFTSFFQNEKVSIPISTRLIFHDTTFGTTPLKTVETKWLNYYFADSEGKIRY